MKMIEEYGKTVAPFHIGDYFPGYQNLIENYKLNTVFCKKELEVRDLVVEIIG
jgi:hypothetical protein